MAHIQYLLDRSESESPFLKRMETIIGFLDKKATYDAEISFWKKEKFNRWYCMSLYSVSYGGIGLQLYSYIGQEKAILYETAPGFFLNASSFYKDDSEFKKRIRNFVINSEVIQFHSRSKEDKTKLIKNDDFKIDGVANDFKDFEYFTTDNCIDNFEPMEIMSMIQTYANSKDPELKKLYFEKLQKIILGV
jgi:hypothetical protein